MKEVYPNFYVGNQDDYDYHVARQEGWYIVHACKEPYHRRALGYTGRAAPKTHPEYLIAPRGNRLILNLVDANDPNYIPKEIIDAALMFVHEHLSAGDRVLLHCNEGMSRSPSIAMLYLAKYTDHIPKSSLQEAEVAFRQFYPMYNPKPGIRGFLAANWDYYCNSGQ